MKKKRGVLGTSFSEKSWAILSWDCEMLYPYVTHVKRVLGAIILAGGARNANSAPVNTPIDRTAATWSLQGQIGASMDVWAPR